MRRRWVDLAARDEAALDGVVGPQLAPDGRLVRAAAAVQLAQLAQRGVECLGRIVGDGFVAHHSEAIDGLRDDDVG